MCIRDSPGPAEIKLRTPQATPHSPGSETGFPLQKPLQSTDWLMDGTAYGSDSTAHWAAWVWLSAALL
eukprot:13440640-Alexandrium_andersonii.AAC.1